MLKCDLSICQMQLNQSFFILMWRGGRTVSRPSASICICMLGLGWSFRPPTSCPGCLCGRTLSVARISAGRPMDSFHFRIAADDGLTVCSKSMRKRKDCRHCKWFCTCCTRRLHLHSSARLTHTHKMHNRTIIIVSHYNNILIQLSVYYYTCYMLWCTAYRYNVLCKKTLLFFIRNISCTGEPPLPRLCVLSGALQCHRIYNNNLWLQKKKLLHALWPLLFECSVAVCVGACALEEQQHNNNNNRKNLWKRKREILI